MTEVFLRRAFRVVTACTGLFSVYALSACASASAEGKGADSLASQSDENHDTSGGLVGNPAPDFTVKIVKNGRGRLSLKDLRGKVVLLDFWATFCEPCKKSFPKLEELQARFGSSLAVVGVSEDEPEDKGKISAFVDSHGAKFAIGWDEDKSIGQTYKPETMPSSFLIDRKGVVRFAQVGYHDGEEASVMREIQSLLAQ